MVNIAVVGCAHGELDQIYATIEYINTVKNKNVELLLVCGDFQSIRDNNGKDLASLACPPKFKKLGDFDAYFKGHKRAPVLTIFIGGNHESSAYLWELFYGGWVAPNIYFLGFAGCVRYKGLRIAGLSGIYKGYDYSKPYHENYPFSSETDKRSIYHVREFVLQRLLCLKERSVDILLTHDWPQCVISGGNVDQLLRAKPFFADEVATGTLGVRSGDILVQTLKPAFHFSGHLHVKYASVMQHNDGKQTKFLALGKCLPNQEYMQVLEIETSDSSAALSFDFEWLAVLKGTSEHFNKNLSEKVLAECVAKAKTSLEVLLAGKDLQIWPISGNFSQNTGFEQTEKLTRLLEIDNIFKESQDCNNNEELELLI